MTDLELREKIAYIDRALADAERRRQEIQFEPNLYRLEIWKIVVTALAAGAALFAAGAAFMKLVG